MLRKKKKNTKTVETLTHDEASRKNSSTGFHVKADQIGKIGTGHKL